MTLLDNAQNAQSGGSPRSGRTLVRSALRSGKRAARKGVAWPVGAGVARLRQHTPRPIRFVGAYPNVADAIASLPAERRDGYDDKALAGVSFQPMSQVALWDFPVIYWLREWATPGSHVLDMGGNLATKYIAFARHLDLKALRWTIQELPEMAQAARDMQASGTIPSEPEFITDVAQASDVDIFLGSGLLQYLDVPLASVIDRLARRSEQRPERMILNKVATRDGPELVTLEMIGRNRVPYRIRSRKDFEAELDQMGYRIVDSWTIPSLSHRIPTHPWMGESESRGYALEVIPG